MAVNPTTDIDIDLNAPLPPECLPDYDAIITEDDTPVDNIFSEKQQRLLAESLYTSWPGPGEERPFLVLANVGLFYALHQPPFVPDALLSVDVRAPDDLWPKPNRSYFIWMYGKPPDVVIEIVSNQKGGEDSTKLQAYARIGITHYVIFDPGNQLGGGVLRVYTLHAGAYLPQPDRRCEGIGLGLMLWEGAYEGTTAVWLRWCDGEGHIIPTGAERAAQERQRAEQAELAREQERQRAEQERQRAERLAAQLRALGIEPE